MTADVTAEQLRALVLHARDVDADARASFAREVRTQLAPGAVLVETCHRVELYGAAGGVLPEASPVGTRRLVGDDVAVHLVRLAVGRESVVVGEDQVLHQLRSALHSARRQGQLPPELDRLFDIALRAGRQARSWLPARRPTLVDVALACLAEAGQRIDGKVLVVGTGEMGRQAAHALAARNVATVVCGRTPERAFALAAQVGGETSSFVPSFELFQSVRGIVIALAGVWPLAEAPAAALVDSGTWVVDLSAPPALEPNVRDALGRRLVSVDDLAGAAGPPPSDRLLRHLDVLVERSVAEYRRWATAESNRAAARALDERAIEARAAELSALWRRVPALEPAQRAEVERMARHLTERLLRDPLEQLSRDEDGRHVRAARELFRL